MKKQPPIKMFIVRKYIKATSAAQAIRMDRTHPVEDVFIDEDWKRNNLTQQQPLIGFTKEPNDE